MRTISDLVLTDELAKQIDSKKVASSDAFVIKTFRVLVEQSAKLAYLNKDYLLFFRGQSTDYRNKSNNSTFYPSIYRDEYLEKTEIQSRFRILSESTKSLIGELKREKITGVKELIRKKYVQWSILQHYEVCATPLLDFTQSLRVACSFALLNNQDEQGFVFVFGLPYLTNRISINSEHDLVNVRLLSICPPEALRPYFQEGYLAGTEDITTEYESKTELDFNNRLIAKFAIPNTKRFWGKSFAPIPRDALYPSNDKMLDICSRIRIDVEKGFEAGNVGEFLQMWNRLEANLGKSYREKQPLLTARDVIRRLVQSEKIPNIVAMQLDDLRRFRNKLVHQTDVVNAEELIRYLQLLRDLIKQIRLFGIE